MLLLPHGRIFFQNLDVDFVNFRTFVSRLGEQKFSGYVHFHSISEEAVIFFKIGSVPGAYYHRGSQSVVGQRAFVRILSEVDRADDLHAVEEKAVIDTYKFKPHFIPPLYTLCFHDTIQRNLEIDLVDLPDLVNNMKTKKFTGGIHFHNNNQSLAYILFDSGELIGAYYLEDQRLTSELAPIFNWIESRKDCRLDILKAK